MCDILRSICMVTTMIVLGEMDPMLHFYSILHIRRLLLQALNYPARLTCMILLRTVSLFKTDKPLNPLLPLNPHGVPLGQTLSLETLNVEIYGRFVPLSGVISHQTCLDLKLP
jgi:hypothetical protein